MRIIDSYSHVLPKKYYEAVMERSGGTHAISGLLERIPALIDVNRRLSLMDRHGVDEQVLVPATPAVETVADRQGAAELTRIANDGIADIVAENQNRFYGVGMVPMNNPAAMVEELDRAVDDLGLSGVLLYTSSDDRVSTDSHIGGVGRPIDQEAFEPFYERVAHHDVPIWLHPARPRTTPDYVGELDSKYLIWQIFGWPFEVAAAMARLVFSGLMDRHELTVIAHHAGSLVPFLSHRMSVHYDLFESTGENYGGDQPKPYADLFNQFYADTATFGNVAALRTAYEFFGADHLIFGTDSPFDAEGGDVSIEVNKTAFESLNVEQKEREQIAASTIESII
jgi:aminocarboxymuconate-semialdehyde decarboxylase